MKSTTISWRGIHAAPQRGLACVGLGLGLIGAFAFDGAAPSVPPIDTRLPTAQNNGAMSAWAAPAVSLPRERAASETGPQSPFRPTLAAMFERPDRNRSVQPLLNRNGVVFVSAPMQTVGARTKFEPLAAKATVRSKRQAKRGPILASLREQPPFLRLMSPRNVFAKPAGSLPVADAITALEAPATQVSIDKTLAPSPTSARTTDAENRRAATLGIAPDSLRFDDRPGRLSSAAEAGVWTGQPAPALGLGYTLPNGLARVNAAGVSSGQKTFGVTAVASIALQ